MSVQLEISWSSLASLTVKSHSLLLRFSWGRIHCGSHCCTNTGEILKLNPWCRGVCQGYHCSNCWLMLTQLKLWFPLSFKVFFLLFNHARMLWLTGQGPSQVGFCLQCNELDHIRGSHILVELCIAWTLSSYIVHLRNIKRWRKIWAALIKCNHERCITDIFRSNVGNQKFTLIRSLWSDIQNHTETTSVTAG